MRKYLIPLNLILLLLLISGCDDFSTPQNVTAAAFRAVQTNDVELLNHALDGTAKETYANASGLKRLASLLSDTTPVIHSVSMIKLSSGAFFTIYRVEVTDHHDQRTERPFLTNRVRCFSQSCRIESIRLATEEAQELIDAIVRDNVSVFMSALNDEANLNGRNADGITPLMAAVEHGRYEAARILVFRRADVALRDSAGRTALMRAESRGDSEMIKLLRAAGAR